MLTHRSVAGLTILSLIVLFIGANLLAGTVFNATRLDLTERGLFTLSAGTKAMLAKLEEPVTLKLYFSEELAQNYSEIRGYGTRVRDLLSEIRNASKGKVSLEVIDPEPFSPEEDLATAYGLTGAQTESGEKLFLGLVGTNLVDGLQTIPFFSPEREEHLEYDVARLIHSLSSPDLPVLGLISGLPLEMGPGGVLAQMQGNAAPYVIYEQLRQSYEIETIADGADRIPETVRVLLIAHPGELAPKTLYAIDQFALRGGRLIVLVDPFAESAQAQGFQGQPMPGAVRTSDLAPLLAAWGVAYDKERVAFDRLRALEVQFGGGGGASQVMPYVAWLRLTGEDIAEDDLVTNDIESMQVASAGFLKAAEGATTTFRPLLQTSAESQAERSLILSIGGDPKSLLDNFVPGGERLVIAARVSGPVKTAFPDGPPKEEPQEEGAEATNPAPAPSPAPHLVESTVPLNLIVMADSDFLEDRFWVEVQDFLGQRIAQPTSGNGFFVLNAIENMVGSDDLISLRSRQRSERPFEVVNDLERAARERYRAEEQRLRAEIAETEKRLKALLARSSEDGALVPEDASGPVLGPDAQREVRRFEERLAETRLALRAVERELRRDVTNLGGWIKFINIAAVPALVAAAAFAVNLAMRRRGGGKAGAR